MRASSSLTAMTTEQLPLGSDKMVATAAIVDSDPEDASAAQGNVETRQDVARATPTRRKNVCLQCLSLRQN